MTKESPFFPKLDPIAERRRALAKVYMLLLKLAEEAEKQTSDAHARDEESAGNDISVSENKFVN